MCSKIHLCCSSLWSINSQNLVLNLFSKTIITTSGRRKMNSALYCNWEKNVKYEHICWYTCLSKVHRGFVDRKGEVVVQFLSKVYINRVVRNLFVP